MANFPETVNFKNYFNLDKINFEYLDQLIIAGVDELKDSEEIFHNQAAAVSSCNIQLQTNLENVCTYAFIYYADFNFLFFSFSIFQSFGIKLIIKFYF